MTFWGLWRSCVSKVMVKYALRLWLNFLSQRGWRKRDKQNISLPKVFCVVDVGLKNPALAQLGGGVWGQKWKAWVLREMELTFSMQGGSVCKMALFAEKTKVLFYEESFQLWNHLRELVANRKATTKDSNLRSSPVYGWIRAFEDNMQVAMGNTYIMGGRSSNACSKNTSSKGML